MKHRRGRALKLNDGSGASPTGSATRRLPPLRCRAGVRRSRGTAYAGYFVLPATNSFEDLTREAFSHLTSFPGLD